MTYRRMIASVLAAGLVLGGCGSAAQVHRTTADEIAKNLNTLTKRLEGHYNARQKRALRRACGTVKPGQAEESCRVEARDALVEVRGRWTAVWEAHAQLQTAHDAYVEALKGDTTGQRLRYAASELRAEFDDLRKLVRELGLNLDGLLP